MNHYRYRRNRDMYTAGSSAVAATYVIDEYFVKPGDEQFAAYEEDLEKSYEAALQNQAAGEDVRMEYARSQGVENAWEMNSFWASEETNAPDEVFQYVSDSGEVVYFTDEEQALMRDWESGGPAPIDGIEGHHLQTIKENPNNPELAADSDNIMFAISEGHRTHLHSGDTQNPTDPEYMNAALTNDQKYAMTLEHNEDILTLSIFEEAGATIASSVLVSMTISQIIRMNRLKNDPRPWSMKKRELTSGILPDLGRVGMISASVWMAHEAVSSISGIFLAETSSAFLIDILAINASFFAVSLILAAKDYWTIRHQSGLSEEAINQFKAKMMIATAELISFTALGVAFEFGLGMLGDLAVDALIPDPTGVIIAARMIWSGVKIYNKHQANKVNIEAYYACNMKRFSYLRSQADLSLEAGDETAGRVF
ncbi:hypothetical protein [Jeotgalibacillus sp. R-1-5s-1]|uniref:hypothetical protein n=1 Tax=Jeotgalibacillus sp. R-1-5s-1 TaxID=2555897 RepID=UPI00106C097A|nr:hypothetical protein [Jeotgalibacillus sp. R-1-5s-1]TFD97050.1 hypothetical protein E2491_10170 [Jeotgalibacillus sp. R-1-5s-1]